LSSARRLGMVAGPMPQILCLIAPPGGPALDRPLLARAAERVRAADATVGEPDWLAPAEAVDLPLSGAEAGHALADALRTELAVDAAILPAGGRRKKLLVADMDSTIVTAETLDELAAHAGLGARVKEITRRAMEGKLDFPSALRERVGMLKGLPVAALTATAQHIELTGGARELVQTMRAHGAFTILVSGGFRFFTGLIRDRVGFHEDVANDLVIDGGKLTGKVAEPIVGREAKLDTLQRLTVERGLDAGETLAVGDGANDLAMIQAAGMGVAFHAKPLVAEAAHVRIDRGDLSALLYLQGYRKSEFVS
jgi:phosphoserine phosphatase